MSKRLGNIAKTTTRLDDDDHAAVSPPRNDLGTIVIIEYDNEICSDRLAPDSEGFRASSWSVCECTHTPGCYPLLSYKAG